MIQAGFAVVGNEDWAGKTPEMDQIKYYSE
jgi:hypothetical protein